MAESMHWYNPYCTFPHPIAKSVLIEYVEYEDAFEHIIAEQFEKHLIGLVDHINWVKKVDKSGKPYYIAYVYFKSLFDSECSKMWQKDVIDPCYCPNFEGRKLGKWLVKKNIYPPNKELIEKEKIIYLNDRVKYLEQMHKRTYAEQQLQIEELNEKIYLLGESLGEIILQTTPLYTDVTIPTAGATVGATAGGAGPAAISSLTTFDEYSYPTQSV